MASFDAYEVLEIERSADPVQVRRAYQRLARRYHPELYPGDPAAHRRFQEIGRAYRILGDEELRRCYDAGLLQAEGGPAAPAPEPSDGPGRRPTARLISARYLEIYAARPTRAQEGHSRGPDLHAEVTVDFAAAIRGTVTSLSVQRERQCDDCRDAGETTPAERCEGCSGRGVVVDLERVRARLPPGIGDGERLRLRGRGGMAGPAGPAGPGEAGDLVLTVRVRRHAYFRREGLDVHAEVPVSFAEACLGAEIEVPTIDGPVRVKVPAGTSGGQRFRLRGRGVRLAGGRAGDHYFSVRVMVPREVDERTRELVERLPEQDPRQGLPREPL